MTQFIFECKGCGEYDSIVAVDAVPSIQPVSPTGRSYDDLEYSVSECFWEAETPMGYGCTNDSCKYSQVQYGLTGVTHPCAGNHVLYEALPGPSLKTIAKIVSNS